MIVRKSFIFSVLLLIVFCTFSSQHLVSASPKFDPTPPPSTPFDLPPETLFPRFALLTQGEGIDLIIPEVVGGSVVDPPNSYPWMASLQFLEQHYCGGILLTSEWVLTAAHCWTDPYGDTFPVSEYDTVVLGEFDLSTISGNEQVIAPDDVYIHPDFDHTTFKYDFALLHLSMPAVLDDYVQNINYKYLAAPENSPAIIMGWGDTAYGGSSSEVLLEGNVEILPDSACAGYGSAYDPESMLCAGTLDGGVDTCPGDSGGPIIFQDPTYGTLPAGITSWGYQCGVSGFPGVYGRFQAAMPWVEKITGTFCSGVTAIPYSECQALVSFFTSTHGNQWYQQYKWLSDPDPCTWFGIACDGGHVVELAPWDVLFSGNYLYGTLPSEIGDLTELKVLNIKRGDVGGDFPSGLWTLSNLEYLNLNENEFSGPLPTEVGNLANLNYLDFSENNFSGPIIPELFTLQSLTQLKLSQNSLEGNIPTEIGSLTNLELLWLGMNQLDGEIPTQISTLGNLANLDISHNQLTGTIPTAFGSMTFHNLDLSNNQLTGELPEIYPRPNPLYGSTRFVFENNQFSGSIPRSFENVDNLNLRSNQFSGDVPSLKGRYILLANNNLDGVINPPATSSDPIPEGRIGDFSNNLFSGPIPDVFFEFDELNLSGNQFSGEIPAYLWSRNPDLDHLDISENQISGNLPVEVENSDITFLWVDHTNLDGPIPAEYIGHYLHTFHFDNTQICIPESADMHTWLETIWNLSSTGISCDSTPPAATWIRPTADSFITQPRAQLEITATDTESGVQGVEFFAFYGGEWYSQGLGYTKPDNRWWVTFPTFDIEDETISVRAVASDHAGNQTVLQLNDLPVISMYQSGPGPYQARSGTSTSAEVPADTIYTEPDSYAPPAKLKLVPANLKRHLGRHQLK